MVTSVRKVRLILREPKSRAPGRKIRLISKSQAPNTARTAVGKTSAFDSEHLRAPGGIRKELIAIQNAWAKLDNSWASVAKMRNEQQYAFYARACGVTAALKKDPAEWASFCADKKWQFAKGARPKAVHRTTTPLRYVLRWMLMQGPNDKVAPKVASDIHAHIAPLFERGLPASVIYKKLCDGGVFKLPRKQPGKQRRAVVKQSVQKALTTVNAVLALEGNGRDLLTMKAPSNIKMTARLEKVGKVIQMTLLTVNEVP